MYYACYLITHIDINDSYSEENIYKKKRTMKVYTIDVCLHTSQGKSNYVLGHNKAQKWLFIYMNITYNVYVYTSLYIHIFLKKLIHSARMH